MGKPCKKVPYPGVKAEMAAKRRHGNNGKGKLLHAYQCDKCGRWHLGNTPGTRIENLMRIFDRLPPSDRATY
jgi:hypothetical protein